MQFVNPFDLITEDDERGVRTPAGSIKEEKPIEESVNDDEDLICF